MKSNGVSEGNKTDPGLKRAGAGNEAEFSEFSKASPAPRRNVFSRKKSRKTLLDSPEQKMGKGVRGRSGRCRRGLRFFLHAAREEREEREERFSPDSPHRFFRIGWSQRPPSRIPVFPVREQEGGRREAVRFFHPGALFPPGRESPVVLCFFQERSGEAAWSFTAATARLKESAEFRITLSSTQKASRKYPGSPKPVPGTARIRSATSA